MNCPEFLRRYSDFRDGTSADPRLESRMLEHVRTCPKCMQYDARVSRGVTLLRSLSDLDPSPGFRRALRRRLAQPDLTVQEPVTPAPAGIMVALMVITAAALAWWEVSDRTTEAATAPGGESPHPTVVVNPGPPFVSFPAPGGFPAAGAWGDPAGTSPVATPAALSR
jgi:hypothetical protein